MTERSESAQQQASKEATDWLILLQDDPDDADLLRRFDAWLRASPTNEEAWAATRHTIGTIGSALPAYAEHWAPFVAERRDAEAGPRPVPPARASTARHDGPGKPIWPRRTLKLAALAAAACIALLFAPDALLQMQADHRTKTAEIRTLELDDGSTVVLAPESAIALSYGARQRGVELLTGEAFFDVASDVDRPFRVTARDMRATVLGTAFSVLSSDDGATVALQHGRVQISSDTTPPPLSEALRAGQTLQVSRTGEVIRGSRPPSQIAAWRQGQLIAIDQPMAIVVDRLRRYYKGAIILANRSLANRPVTGLYSLDDPVDALRGIAGAHGATVHRVTPWLLIVARS